MIPISNKAFTKFITLMANQPISASRLSALIDASPDEGIDVLMFGRLVRVKVQNEGALQSLLIRKAQRNLYGAAKLNTVTFDGVEVISVGKIEIHYSYEYTSDDGKSTKRKACYSCLATDEENDGVFEFEYKD